MLTVNHTVDCQSQCWLSKLCQFCTSCDLIFHHFSPFNCCLSVVLSRDKGDYPKRFADCVQCHNNKCFFVFFKMCLPLFQIWLVTWLLNTVFSSSFLQQSYEVAYNTAHCTSGFFWDLLKARVGVVFYPATWAVRLRLDRLSLQTRQECRAACPKKESDVRLFDN